ncbi:uncharacterized protein (TIGR02246 family) [Sphingomonas endophytica]|uniref:Uncharacterized protein (TIGR02246 family) n=1 Tax=Sphingomonas endophytica TaxID=869719 RepID=A0ABR6N2V3_9SPHN|nr:uncharacterized protein (TIGR02246 family) [Sphingomonas endophytica]
MLDLMTSPKLLAQAKSYFNDVQLKTDSHAPLITAQDKPQLSRSACAGRSSVAMIADAVGLWSRDGRRGVRRLDLPAGIGLLRWMMRDRFWLLTAALCLASPAAADPAQDRAAILTLVAQMEQAWNRGDFRGYMAGFSNPDVVFVSSGRFQDGWQGTLDHYVRDYGGSPRTRGTLHFYDMKIELLADDAAMLVGRYHLERPVRAAEGVNTRLFRKIAGRWVITLNHVSAHDVPSRPAAPVSERVPSAPAARQDPPSS